MNLVFLRTTTPSWYSDVDGAPVDPDARGEGGTRRAQYQTSLWVLLAGFFSSDGRQYYER